MNEQTTTEQLPVRPVVTFEIVKAKFNKELSARKYQEALNRFSSMVITTENVAQAQKTLSEVRKFKTVIGDIKTAGKADAWEECKWWDRVHNDTIAALDPILIAKTKEAQIILDAQAEENRKIAAEAARIEGINRDIDKFLLDAMAAIANAKTLDEIVTVEKLIGSHKSNKTKYQEFLSPFIERCNTLVPIIKKQKEVIKALNKLAKQKEAADKSGDDKTFMELEDKEAELNESLDETKITLQEEAIRQATAPDIQTVQGEQTDVNYRRKSWKWEVKDIKELYKKMPHLVELTPAKDKIDDMLRTKKADKSLDGVEEVVINGIRFYLEKLV